jgi:hypothetical protein
MKKIILILVVIVSLLLSCTMIASAEVLFGLTAETGNTDFTANYKSALPLPDVSKSTNALVLDSNFNLLGTHINVEYSKDDMNNNKTFSTAGVKVGWEFGPDILTLQVFGGYQEYVFSDTLDNSFTSLVGGLGVESKVAVFTFYGSALIPIQTNFSNGAQKDDNASLSYVLVGATYSPLPFVDLCVNYRAMSADSNVLKISSTGYTVGVKISF